MRNVRRRVIGSGALLLVAAVALSAGPASTFARATADKPRGMAFVAQAPSGSSDTQSPPSPPEVVAAMLKLAGVTKNDVVYDLGSGDGRIAIAAAKMYGARAVGIELDAQLVKTAREKAQSESVGDRVRFVQQDLFKADISEATVVTMYLLPTLNLQLLPKLNRELKPGTRVVSQSFDFGGPRPKATIDVAGRPVYLWVAPIR